MTMDRQRLESILTSLAIRWERLTRNAVNVDCPHCGDTGKHCGIFVSNLRYHCWKCRKTGSLRRLLRTLGLPDAVINPALEGVAIVREDETLADQVIRALSRVPPPAEGPRPPVVLPPSEPVTQDVLDENPLLRRFLRSRRYYSDVCEAFDARWGGNSGSYRHRLILPVYDAFGRLAAFQARDCTGQTDPKYLTEGRVSELLYWTDLVWVGQEPRRLYVVEGVFDAWRMGINAVATFTHGISRLQRCMLLTDDRIDEVVFAWDGDSYGLSIRAAQQLAPLKRAGAVRPPTGQDPDSMGWRAVRELEITWA